MTDEAFVKAWGNLSDEPLTFAGTIRFLRLPAVSIATGPPPCQLLVDPEVQLTIESGRIAVNLSADLTTVSGRCDQVELALPPGPRARHGRGRRAWRLEPARARAGARSGSRGPP